MSVLGPLAATNRKELTMSDNMLGMSPDDDHLGLVIDFTSKLRSGAITPMAAKRFLRGEVSHATFPVWKIITLGTGLKTAKNFRKALKDAGCKIGDWGNDILGQRTFTVSTEKTEVDLVAVTVAGLGFTGGATRKDIYERAQELGLSLCPAEVGPQLRLQYLDQPMDEWLVVGMEPIAVSDDYLHVFHVERDGAGRWLGGDFGYPDFFWGGGYRFVFVRRK